MAMALDGDGPIEAVLPARERDLGGFRVGRVLPQAGRRQVGPFVFLDHIDVTLPAPVPRAVDVRPHPHIGLATVTYLFEGELTHRDSLGVVQVIRPGEVNWMTAGRGISHSERFDGLRERGGRMHGLQAWIALPTGHEEVEPAFEHVGADRLSVVELPGARVRVIAGSLLGATSPVSTLSPLLYAHIELDAGAAIALPAAVDERAVYVVQGRVELDAVAVAARTLAVLKRAVTPRLQAREASTVMLLGGAALGERFVWWNFVASRRERIEQARRDWSGGRIALPPGDDQEFIPLPDGSG